MNTLKNHPLAFIIIVIIFSCGQQSMKTPNDAMNQFEVFKNKEKFNEDPTSFYSGLADPSLKPELSSKINQVADDFKVIAQSDDATAEKYQKKIGIGLNRFAGLYQQLDTEDRERICNYFEELMDIVGLESSAGQLNNFMYGFDPAAKD